MSGEVYPVDRGLGLPTPWSYDAATALGKLRAAVRRIVASYRELAQESATVRADLLRFGRHLPFCIGGERRCTCGFSDACLRARRAR